MKQNAFVIEQFNEFYQELLNAKAQMVALSQAEEKIPLHEQEKQVDALNNRLAVKLSSLFSLSHEKDWSHGRNFYREAQYVLAVLADEVLINTEWFGRELWQHHLLEFRVFKSNNAGDLFFEKVDHLLKEGNHLNAGLAEVYLLALILGFQGKYRGNKEAAKVISEYKRELFIFIYGREYDSHEVSEPIFKHAYQHTLSRVKTKLLPVVDRFVIMMVGIIVIYLGVSQIIWRVNTKEIRKLTAEAVTHVKQLSRI